MAIPTLDGSSRKRCSEEAPQPQAKRAVPWCLIANLIKIRDFEEASENKIWLCKKDLTRLFLGTKEQNPHYVQIANYVYEATVKDWVPEGSIALNSAQYEQYSSKEGFVQCPCRQSIIVKPFILEEAKWPKLNSLSVELSGFYGQTTVYVSDMTRLLEQICEQPQYFKSGQILFLNYSQTAFRGTLCNFSALDGAKDFGIVTKESKITFTGFAASNLLEPLESERIGSIDLDFFYAYSKQSDASDVWKNGGDPLPIVVKDEAIKKMLKEHLDGKEMKLHENFSIKYDNFWDLNFRFHALHLKESGEVLSKYTQVITFDPSIELKVMGSNDLRLEPSEFETAIFARIKLLKGNGKEDFVALDQLKKALIELKKPLYKGQEIVVDLPQYGKVLLLVKFMRSAASSIAQDQFAAFDEQTNFDFVVANACDLSLVDSCEGKELSRVCIEVERESYTSRPKTYEESELLELMKEQLPLKFFESQSFKVQAKDGEELSFSIASLRFLQSNLPKNSLKTLGFLGEQSSIEWQSDDLSLKIVQDPTIRIPSEKELLEKFNIGGLSSQFATIIRSILLSRSYLRQEIERRKIKPARGLLLYGPPGNGKTALARKLGEMLQCKEENVNLIVGSQIWNKWLGNSEANIRKLFEPARADQKAHGAESSMHLLIIDEIDAMLASRGDEGSKSKDSAVNQFLSELDGLQPINNILVVGLTNNKAALDPAVLRPGRFDVQIEIPMPKKEARVEIFEVYSKALRKEGLLANDLDFEGFYEKTDAWSGADIEALFEQSKLYSIERLRALPRQTDLSAHPDGLIYQKDFQSAYEMIVESKGKSANKLPPSGLYT